MERFKIYDPLTPDFNYYEGRNKGMSWIHEEEKALKEYYEVMTRVIKTNFPTLTYEDIHDVISYSCAKHYKDEQCKVYNNYLDKTVQMTLKDLTNYIKEREVCITGWGVMFKHSTDAPNPLKKMIQMFMESRDVYKKEMFKYVQGSENFEKYNLLQLLAKLDANALYGSLGMYSCMYYNIHVSASVTTQGRELISAAGLCFEAFLANNVKFGSLDQVICFIDNIVEERPLRKFKDSEILSHIPCAEEVFAKLVMTCGFEWIPTEEELQLILNYVYKLDQESLNRIFYKNNLYGFMDNDVPSNAMFLILDRLETPFLNPNKPNKEIEVELEVLKDLLYEYVYYQYQYIDKIDRMDNMIKSVDALSDTDSAIVSFDAWYQYNLKKYDKIDFKLLKVRVDLVEQLEKDEFGDIPPVPLIEEVSPLLDYDFYEEETIEIERQINLCEIIPQDGLRYSILNIIANIMTFIVNDYIRRFCMISHSWTWEEASNGKCLMYLKNEFTFLRALLTMNKKNYATIRGIQEGTLVPKSESLDLKGLAIDKSSMNMKTRTELKRILFEDILDTDTPSQLKVLKSLAIMEDDIYKSLAAGDKSYYKPMTVKAMSAYPDPLGQQGIKACLAWNMFKDDHLEAIDMNERNSVDVAKVRINPGNIHLIRDTYPEIYKKMVEQIGDGVKPPSEKFKKVFKKGEVTSFAIPKDCDVPKWLVPFINYTEIININLKNFPLDSIGGRRLGKDNINYTNIVKM